MHKMSKLTVTDTKVAVKVFLKESKTFYCLRLFIGCHFSKTTESVDTLWLSSVDLSVCDV